MNKPAYSVAVVGATGLVGKEIITVLEERRFPLAALRLYASPRTAGDEATCGDLGAVVELLDGAHFEGTDIVFLAAGERVSAEWATRAADAGAVVVDLSQVYADDADVPLVVPEVNGRDIAAYVTCGLIAVPTPPAIALVCALNPLHEAAGVSRVAAVTFESVSSAGRAGIEELQRQTLDLMNGRSTESGIFPHRIAFNLLPQVGDLLAGGSSSGEAATGRALRRLLDAPDLHFNMTRVVTPLFFGTALAVTVDTTGKLSADEARACLRSAPGVLLQDEAAAAVYPTLAETVGQDATCVGRLRNDEGTDTLDMWITIDNIRKGSAVNAVQIAELLIRDHL
jgi:aspartate-semialdehyde dehydrogenase